MNTKSSEKHEPKLLKILISILKFIANLFGFTKLSNEEKRYLHETNIKSSSYMAFIIIILEVWLISRQMNKYVIPLIKEGGKPLNIFFSYCSLFCLFIVISIGVMLFCQFYNREKNLTKARFIGLLSSGIICTLWIFFLKMEKIRDIVPGQDNTKAIILNVMLVAMYLMTMLLGITIVAYSILKYKNYSKLAILEHLVIIWFTLICLAFGIRVSYNDYIGGKEIICFLTMTIYIGCLLIYRPYITLLMLCVCFFGFLAIVQTYRVEGKKMLFDRGEGDYVNYITFLVSLSTICLTMYQGRLLEARKTKELERKARYDELTNLENFNYFIEKAKNVISNTTSDIYTFIYIDMKNFKAYNDQRGFEKGNELLIKMGDFISEIFYGDIFARQADDHFVVMTLKNDYLDKIKELDRRINESDKDILLGVSAGGYHLISKDENIRRCVDRARYAARLIKKNYKEIYNEYDKKQDEEYHKMLYIINNINAAINNDWIRPYYQPVVWSDTHELCGCEALARWFDPVYGQLFPNEFIGVLEEYRLIHILDKAIFNKVCRDLRENMDNNLPVVPVSVNLSRLDFELMDVVSELEKAVSEYNIPRKLIHVEITESALVDNFNEINNAINIFRKKGYAIWLDDFGSGYSSLNVLKYYDFEVIKIDMNFLSNFDTNEKTKIIIDTIIQMANNLNMHTLTEGVETKEEAAFLKEIGCGRLQGYLFGKPISKEELLKLIKEGILVVSKNIL